ncbi:MAG: hypothetical protein MUC74_09700 [Ideonella sp.]|nr:hypothetical protein [Ideonella sp.]
MSPIVGWILAGIAVVAGWLGWGVPGVVLAVTVITFWLLLQFSRALRVMRMAAGRPVGHVDSAVMLQSRLTQGMTMMQVIPLTRSLGERVGNDDTWRWRDTGGDAVTLVFQRGKLASWAFVRVATPDADSATP